MSRQDAVARAIDRLAPGAEWVLRGSQYGDLEWLDLMQPKPDEATLTVVADEIEDAPDVIDKARALLYLKTINKTEADVFAAIATIEDPDEREIAEIEWNHRPTFRHDHQMFVALGPKLGITDMVAAFRAAAEL